VRMAGTKQTKYYFLVLLGAFLVAAGVLVVAPQAQSQTPPRDCAAADGGQVCLEKTADPTTVRVGEQITFTVRLTNETSSQLRTNVPISDRWPPEIRIDSVSQSVTRGSAPPCTATGDAVTCPNPIVLPAGGEFGLTIVTTATQPGSSVNNAVLGSGAQLNVEAPFTVLPVQDQPQGQPQDQPQDQQPNGGGSPAPITQEGEQESEAGEIDQSFDVS
jgi:uncharacterized repeat protein (TIGR01451 family)